MLESKYIDKKTVNMAIRGEMRNIADQPYWPKQYTYVYAKMFPEDYAVHGKRKLWQVMAGQLVNPVIVANVRKMDYELMKNL